ncbi:MAG: M28 family peptidase [Gemmatimonadetes bacterium]|nr:M28 family peptidase [Gemmatimonadota bacterium]
MISTRFLFSALAALLGPSLAAAQAIAPAPLPRTHAPRPTAPALNAADLTTRIYQFADDSMHTREAGTIGNVKGTDYLAREVQRLGLQPAGENGTYFQTVPLVSQSLDPASRLEVGGAALGLRTEWGPIQGATLTNTSLPVVFAGTFGAPPSVSPEQARGKLVVWTFDPRMAGNGAPIEGAAAFAVIAPAEFFGAGADPAGLALDRPSGAGEPPVLYVTPGAANRLFDSPVAQLQPGAAGKTVSLDLRYSRAPAPFPARNVIAILPGSDPALRGQYVAIGAHSDHVGAGGTVVDHDSMRIFNRIVRPQGAEQANKRATPAEQAQVNAELAAYRLANPGTARTDSINNGADDDASGSMAVLEIAEWLTSQPTRPKRSVLFVWHTAEELGLFGSEHFTDHPTVPRDSIVAQLNIDMVGRGGASDLTGLSADGRPLRGNPNYLQLIGSRRLSTELGDLAETVNRTGQHGLSFDYSLDANGHPANIYCRSDHYNYARYGIPVIFFTTGGHADYHQVTDEPQYIDYTHLARVASYIGDLLVNVANLGKRPTVDRPVAGPGAPCQQ